MADTIGTGPADILIVGAGVFGLSTALALLEREAYKTTRITVIDSADVLPNPVGSSVDSSRIVRADYAQYSYAKLACLAQEYWRDQTPSGWGGEGRYDETGFVITCDKGKDAYVRSSMTNVQSLAKAGLPMDITKIQALESREEICKATGLTGSNGDTGYANWNSGWADAEASVAFAIKNIHSHPNARDRVTILPGNSVKELLFSDTTKQCTGVLCTNGRQFLADLTILATGAWTPSLWNLQNRCLATGQVLAYFQISAEEQAYLEKKPVIINFHRGTFVIPPLKQELKIARHGYGYRNFTTTPQHQSTTECEISVPRTDTQIPLEAEETFRAALAELFPPSFASAPPNYPASLADISTRPFSKTRLCWYTDTPTGNFLFDYPPLIASPPTSATPTPINKSLFIATGGSGHGFKFFPILGSYIVDAVEGRLDAEYRELWRWPNDEELVRKHGFTSGDEQASQAPKQFTECRDGSRGGPLGMILGEELEKGVAKVGI